MTYSELIERIMPRVNGMSLAPFIVSREGGEWKLQDAGLPALASVRERDPYAFVFTGAYFGKGSYPYVYDKYLTSIDKPLKWLYEISQYTKANIELNAIAEHISDVHTGRTRNEPQEADDLESMKTMFELGGILNFRLTESLLQQKAARELQNLGNPEAKNDARKSSLSPVKKQEPYQTDTDKLGLAERFARYQKMQNEKPKTPVHTGHTQKAPNPKR